MFDLQEIEAIKRLKYKYFRCLDSKLWEEMAECFVEDATCAYDSGKYSFQGRDAIVGFLAQALGSHDVMSLHHGHHPEIELTSETTATGVWYLEDRVFVKKQNTMLWGAAFYNDEYIKVNGQWKLQSTGYVRTFEEIQNRAEGGLNLTGWGDHLRAPR